MRLTFALLTYLVLTTSSLASNGSLNKTQVFTSPNLVFILTDEQRYDTSAPYGNKIIKTPNLNMLAQEAVTFKRAYVTQPLCSPARASIMTGLYPQQNGVFSNKMPLSHDIQTLPELVGVARYHAAYIGKWHLGDENKVVQGFDERIGIEDIYSAKDPNNNSDYHDFLLAKGYRPDHKFRAVFTRDFAASLPYEHSKSKFIESQALKFLERNKAQPFILYLGFFAPHSPINGPFNDLHNASDITLNAAYEIANEETNVVADLKYLKDPIRTIQKYYGRVHQVDKSVGAIRAKLAALGLADNTIIVYTSEHGNMLGERHSMFKNKMFDGAARIPLFIKAPGIKSGIVATPVSQIDLVPTLLHLMGIDKPITLPGTSLFAKSSPQQKSVSPTAVFIQRARGTKKDSKTYELAYVNEDWKLMINCENNKNNRLYQLKNDPFELLNRYENKKNIAIKEKMSKVIKKWTNKQKISCPALFSSVI
jgi:arylsulfatase